MPVLVDTTSMSIEEVVDKLIDSSLVQGKDYGFIDHVVTSAREAADEGRPARSK